MNGKESATNKTQDNRRQLSSSCSETIQSYLKLSLYRSSFGSGGLRWETTHLFKWGGIKVRALGKPVRGLEGKSFYLDVERNRGGKQVKWRGWSNGSGEDAWRCPIKKIRSLLGWHTSRRKKVSPPWETTDVVKMVQWNGLLMDGVSC